MLPSCQRTMIAKHGRRWTGFVTLVKEPSMAINLAVKFAITAAALGCATRKDLARAFARANPGTSFDLDRSYKWLQGRAQPRDPRLYTEWLGLLRLGRSRDWILESSSDEFLDVVAEGFGQARAELWQQARAFLGEEAADGSPMAFRRQMEGVFAAYSWAWSPYQTGRLIRGTLAIQGSRRPGRLDVVYSEMLSAGLTRMHGSSLDSPSSLVLSLTHDQGEQPLFFSLLRPNAPSSVLIGHLTGVALVGPQPPLCTTRIVMVRVPAAQEEAEAGNRYLPADQPITADLAQLGLPLAPAEPVEQAIRHFLFGAVEQGVDRITTDPLAMIARLLDPLWLNDGTA